MVLVYHPSTIVSSVTLHFLIGTRTHRASRSDVKASAWLLPSYSLRGAPEAPSHQKLKGARALCPRFFRPLHPLSTPPTPLRHILCANYDSILGANSPSQAPPYCPRCPLIPSAASAPAFPASTPPA